MLYIISHFVDFSKGGSSLLYETSILRFSHSGKVRDAASPAKVSACMFADHLMWIIFTFSNYESSCAPVCRRGLARL